MVWQGAIDEPTTRLNAAIACQLDLDLQRLDVETTE